jgi:hypothetical protein
MKHDKKSGQTLDFCVMKEGVMLATIGDLYGQLLLSLQGFK